MGQAKQLYVVLRFILRKFVNRRGRLWCYRRGAGDLREVSPRDAFVQKHFYSAINEDGTRSVEAEEYIASIEAEAAAPIKRIIRCARAGRPLDITEEEKWIYLKFLRLQLTRSLLMAEILCSDFSEPILRRALNPYNPRDQGPLRVLEYPEVMRRVRQNAWAENLMDGPIFSVKSKNLMMSRDLGVWVIRRPNWSFVIGDYAIVKMPNSDGSGNLEDPGVLELYPVAPDVIIYWGRLPREPDTTVLKHAGRIRRVNEVIAGWSYMIAGKSKQLVESLSHSEYMQGQDRFWPDNRDEILRGIEWAPGGGGFMYQGELIEWAE